MVNLANIYYVNNIGYPNSMLFTNSRSIPLTNHTNPAAMFMQRRQIKTYSPQNTSSKTIPPPPPTPPKKKMKWGQPTWFLFHALAQKVREEHFQKVRKELLDIIYTICTNLPCPDCASHATKYISAINFNRIQTKEQLKDMLFIFHNTVNERKGFPMFNRGDLDAKYAAANLVPIIQNFMVHFRDKHASIHMIANDMHRARLSNTLIQWFQNNLKYFDP